MDITFKTAKMAKVFNSERDLDREYGKQSDAIKRRMAVLRAAATLDRISHLPPERCHELQPLGNGLYAVDLKYPWRLVFAVGNDPIPRKDDGGVDKAKVKAIEIRSVGNYH